MIQRMAPLLVILAAIHAIHRAPVRPQHQHPRPGDALPSAQAVTGCNSQLRRCQCLQWLMMVDAY